MTTTGNLLSLVKDYDAKVKAMREELSNEFKTQFKTISTEIFSKYPEILKFGWTQYTPYFNDGDACVFHYNDMYVCTDPETADGSVYDWDDMYSLKNKYPEVAEFEKVLSSSEDILLAMFGDHVQVTVTSAGIDVDEYEHE
jgi:hypothetical protein